MWTDTSLPRLASEIIFKDVRVFLLLVVWTRGVESVALANSCDCDRNPTLKRFSLQRERAKLKPVGKPVGKKTPLPLAWQQESQ